MPHLIDEEPTVLAHLVETLLRLARWVSPRYWLIGWNPPHDSPKWLLKLNGTAFRRDNLHDIYVSGWTCAELLLLLFWNSVGCSLNFNAVQGWLLLIAVNVHLLEVMLGTVFVMMKRRHLDSVNPRKFAITALAYLDGVFVFAVSYLLLPGLIGITPSRVYSFPPDVEFSSGSMFHFSVACYTTTGWGNIHPVHPVVMFLSSVESLVGTLFIIATIASFVSRLDAIGSAPIDGDYKAPGG